MKSQFVEVALPIPLKQTFTYRFHPTTPQHAERSSQAMIYIGARVQVSFGNRTLVGLVVKIHAQQPNMSHEVKDILSLLDEQPLLSADLYQLCQWATKYYFCSHGQMLNQALPSALRKGGAASASQLKAYQLSDSGNALTAESMKRASAQWQIVQLLQQHKQGLTDEELLSHDINKSSLKTLISKGLVLEQMISQQPDLSWRDQDVALDSPHKLNQEQAITVASILAQQGYRTSLIEGVTGSGKTEVYLTLIAHFLKQGRQALVLVPEIGLTPQTISRFQRRFQVKIAVIHSELTDLARLKAWRMARSGEAAIVIGTRSALFTPLKYPGIIILDEEHDSSFKQQEGVRYHARDLAVMRGYLSDVPVVLGSATPSLETLNNALQGRYQHLQLTHRAGNAQKVRQQVIDICNQPLQAGLSHPLITQIREHLTAGNQVLLFLNRRGFAPALLCHECGHLHGCQRCDAYYTLHQKLNEICCHHCGDQHPIPQQCMACGSTLLAGHGVGTEQLEKKLTQLFPEYPVVRIDRDTTRRKGTLEAHLEAIQRGEYKILVGTQMLAKGHHFPDVTLVGLLDVDGALFSADFRAPERFGQLYTQVAGRAGRADKPGTVLLQTYQHQNVILQTLIDKGYETFAREQLTERHEAFLPPAWHMVLVRAEAHQAEDADAFLQLMAQHLPQDDTFEVIGPMPAPLDKKAGKYRRHLLFQSPERAKLQAETEKMLVQVSQHPLAKKCRWMLDRDPQDLM